MWDWGVRWAAQRTVGAFGLAPARPSQFIGPFSLPPSYTPLPAPTEAEDDYLEFTFQPPSSAVAAGADASSSAPPTGDRLSLVETPWTRRLDPKHFAYLSLYKSPPAFLASVTLESFERSTLSAAGPQR